MGCGESKLDQLRPVVLCRDRAHFLEDAMRNRYVLAEAHGAYVSSLRSVGASLQSFFDEGCCLETSSSSSSPLLTLPPHSSSKGKCKDAPSLSPASSACGSHLHLCESSEDEDDDGDDSASDADFGFPHSFVSTERGVGRYGGGGRGGEYHYGSSSSSSFPPFDATVNVTGAGGFGNVNTDVNHTNHYFHYARKGPPQSVVGIERRKTTFDSEEVATVQVGNFGSGQPFRNPHDGFNYHGDGYGSLQSNQQCGGYGRASEGFHDGFGGFSDPHGSSSSSSSYSFGFRGMGIGSSHRQPPPPPSPPTTSTWDFLNPFRAFDNLDNFDKGYHGSNNSMTLSRSSREVREEEGIPELEDERGGEIFVGHHTSGGTTYAAAAAVASSSAAAAATTLHGNFFQTENGHGRSKGERVRNRVGSINGGDNPPVIDKNVVRDGNCRGRTGTNLVEGGSLPLPNVLEEIRSQFDKASASCEEMSDLLEVGMHSYHQRRRYKVGSSIMMHAMVPPSLSTSNICMPSCSMDGECSAESPPSSFEAEKEKCQRTGGLLATLEKLYVWEKKLHGEVRAEEQLRMLHDKKCKQLKRLDDSGAENQKVEATRAGIKKLSTKIRISIQVIKSISNKISKLRDDELWPLLKKLIQGLYDMWQAVLSCHGNQFQILIKAQTLDAEASSSSGKVSDAHMKATMQLAMALLKWIESFSCWIDATRNYVKALNSWLQKCLNYEPQVTADGIAPFSPGRLGAPPIFVVCNSWSQAMDRISEREVVEAMQAFTAGVLRIWQQHYAERKIRLLTDNDMDRKLKTLDLEDQKIHKAVDGSQKEMFQASKPESSSICWRPHSS